MLFGITLLAWVAAIYETPSHGAVRSRRLASAIVIASIVTAAITVPAMSAFGIHELVWSLLDSKKKRVPPLWLRFVGHTTVYGTFSFLFVAVAEVLQRHRSTTSALQATQRAQATIAREVLEVAPERRCRRRSSRSSCSMSLVDIETLYRQDAPRAADDLDRLISYLRVALPRLRETGSTIEAEIDLVQAYLAVVTSLHGGRPTLSVTLPDDCGRARFYPMLLLPLLQRAVRQPSGECRSRSEIGISRIGSQIAIVLRFAFPTTATMIRSWCACVSAWPDSSVVRRRSIASESATRMVQLRCACRRLRPRDAMTGPTAIVAEDEATLRHQLIEQLGQLWPELAIVGEASDGVQALRLLDEHHPDVLFLDIQMPGATGLEVARQASGRCHVVFVTAYDQHAVAAFDQGAVDYVLKPVSPARLFTAVSRVKAAARNASSSARSSARARSASNAQSPSKQYLRWINASVGQSLKLITVDEISYFQADNKYTRVVTGEGEALIRKPLKELVDELDPNQFWQIHRSTLVNATSIAGVARDFRGRMLVKLKTRAETLLVSDSYTHLFRQM